MNPIPDTSDETRRARAFVDTRRASGAISPWLSSGRTERRPRKFQELPSRLQDGTVEAGDLGGDVGRMNLVACDLWLRLDGAKNGCPCAIPAEAAQADQSALARLSGSPSRVDFVAVLAQSCSLKPASTSADEGVEGLFGVPSIGLKRDGRAFASAEHHQAHDRAGRDGLAVADNVDRGAEALGKRDEFCRSPRV